MGAELIFDGGYIAAAQNRRRQLARRMGDGVLLLTAAAHIDDYSYRQNPYLYYLTAFAEPQSALMLVAEGGKVRREVLFCRRRDAEREKWDGEILGPVRARRMTKIQETADIDNFAAAVEQTAKEVETAYYLPGGDDKLERQLSAIIATRRTRGSDVKLWQLRDAAMPLDEMRVVKDETEIARMREAARLTCIGHSAAMRMTKDARREYQLEAMLAAAFKLGGGGHAFLPIVAAGANALTLHYNRNDAPVRGGQLILADAGCRWRGYAADVSRTYPANGVFDDAQRAVYDVVLRAQLLAIKAAKPGARLDALERAALRVLCSGLRDLGLCRGNVATIIKKQTYRRFYPHRVGHFLGLDVHDVGALKEADGGARILKKGMVLTVEPGLYIPDAPDIPRPLRRIGVRIEDDVLLTAKGCEVLTAAAPKSPAAVEKLQRDE